ncbi:MAG TPA: DNA-3-methyladenine glycosylase I [Candidatus Bathyarchaeia archaeon]|nr:DNA-3-methyladenine glycosylase I [Candidatus Bathyarchaeia archaeon]
MSPMWNAKPPKNDDEYFERMTRSLFTAGLNWKVIEKKWPNFQKAFADFSIGKVAKFSDNDVKRLMTDEGIVRNEKKVQATVHNAAQFLKLEKEFGSFQKYLDTFGKDEERMLEAVQERFQHVGPSTARTFLWSARCELTPTREEKKWMTAHKKQ